MRLYALVEAGDPEAIDVCLIPVGRIRPPGGWSEEALRIFSLYFRRVPSGRTSTSATASSARFRASRTAVDPTASPPWYSKYLSGIQSW